MTFQIATDRWSAKKEITATGVNRAFPEQENPWKIDIFKSSTFQFPA